MSARENPYAAEIKKQEASMHVLEIIEIGDGLGFILPEDLQKKLNARADDTLGMVETATGFTILANDPVPKEQNQEQRKSD
jgi:hypothetical protein